tara:strand:+ start:1353 stop:1559 length:207 start_codon:yes stop_codon:yes gene_type:complete
MIAMMEVLTSLSSRQRRQEGTFHHLLGIRLEACFAVGAVHVQSRVIQLTEGAMRRELVPGVERHSGVL